MLAADVAHGPQSDTDWATVRVTLARLVSENRLTQVDFLRLMAIRSR